MAHGGIIVHWNAEKGYGIGKSMGTGPVDDESFHGPPWVPGQSIPDSREDQVLTSEEMDGQYNCADLDSDVEDIATDKSSMSIQQDAQSPSMLYESDAMNGSCMDES